MNDNTKNIVVTVAFVVFLFIFFIINVFKVPETVSIPERRRLKQFPELTIETILNGEFMNNFGDYALDQFVFRDNLRKIKAVFTYNIFMQKDNNDIYMVNGHVSKYYSTLNELAVKDAALKFNKVTNQYLKNINVYTAIVPDKNYYLAEENGYPYIDYKRLETIFTSNAKMEYISLFDKLTVDNYYTTDSHWRQEKIVDVLITFADKMNFNRSEEYVQKTKEPFYGVYYGQSALPLSGEKLIYNTNSIIENCIVKTLDEKTLEMTDTRVYVESDFENNDPYDIFLGGARPLITVENPSYNGERELYLFRDSFGSSIAPLLIESYSKITIIDLRYIASPLLTNFIDFKEGSDALFLYSTEVLNNSSTIKVL